MAEQETGDDADDDTENTADNDAQDAEDTADTEDTSSDDEADGSTVDDENGTLSPSHSDSLEDSMWKIDGLEEDSDEAQMKIFTGLTAWRKTLKMQKKLRIQKNLKIQQDLRYQQLPRR